MDDKNHIAEKDKQHLSEKLTREILHDLYHVQKKSLQDIASAFDCTRQNIHHIMRLQGIPRRKKSHARTLAIKQDKFEKFKFDDINEDFFRQWTPQMGWVLGLLFTDGNVQRVTKSHTGLRVSICSMDLEVIEKVISLLGSKKNAKTRKQSYDPNKSIYYFEFYREQMRDDLHRLGLQQKKSLIMQFPDVPEEYVRHFVRGCWDGDGSIYISDNKLRASYTCGSLAFIERLAQELYKIGVCKNFISDLNYEQKEKLRNNYPDGKYPLTIHKKHNGNAYEIKFGDRDQLTKFFSYMYEDVDQSMYLTRKYNKFVTGLNL